MYVCFCKPVYGSVGISVLHSCKYVYEECLTKQQKH